MYEAPSQDDLTEIIISADTIKNKKTPIFVYKVDEDMLDK